MGQRADEAQEQLIRRFCEKAELSLQRAPDYETARRLADDLCGQFAEECSSAMVAHATRLYLDQVIERQWGGNNTVDHSNDQH